MKLIKGGQHGAAKELGRLAGAYSKEAVALLADILESAEDLFAALDAEFRFMAFNAAFRREFTAVFGQEPVLRQTADVIFSRFPERRDEVVKIAKRVADGEPVSVTVAFDDAVPAKVFEVMLTPMRNSSGQAFVIALIGRDVTEKQLAEQRFHRLVDASPDAMVIVRNGIIEYVNNLAEAMFGYEPGVLQGKSVEVLVPEGMRERHRRQRDAFEAAPRTRPMGSAGLNLKGRRADGSEFDVDISLAPLDVAGEQVVAAAIRDISHKSKAEQALRQRVEEETLGRKSAETSRREIEEQLEARGAWEGLYRAAFDHAAIGIAILATDQRFQQVNPSWCEMFGYRQEELMQLRLRELMHRDDVGVDAVLNSKILAGLINVYNVEKRFYRKNGQLMWGALAMSVQRDAAGHAEHFIAVVEDITRRRGIEDKLVESQTRLQMAVETAQLGFAEMDLATNEFYLSPEWKAQLGLSDADPPPTYADLQARLHPDDRERVLKAMAAHLASPGVEHWIEYRMRHQSGRYRWFESRSLAMQVAPGKATKIIGIRLDVTDRKETERRIREESLHDPLTGLSNRALIMEYGSRLLAAAQRSHGQCALLFIDLDRFKPINDRFGHDVGDAVLKEVAHRLDVCTRQEDLVGRLGGDEFVAVLANVRDDPDRARVVAEHIVEAVSEPIRVGCETLVVSASVGISYFPEQAAEMQTLMQTADVAMYRAKQQGPGRYAAYRPDADFQPAVVFSGEARFRAALREGSFVLHYQPVLDARTRRLVMVEALVRMVKPDGGTVAPDLFLPVAEATGLIHELGEWILGAACRQREEWIRQQLPPVTISVNISQAQLKDADFTARLRRIVDETGINPARLQLEIAQSIVGADRETREMLRQAKTVGVRISLDGVASSDVASSSELGQLPIDQIKIAPSLVRRIVEEPASEAMTRGIIALGRSLNLEVVGEGIESEAALRSLQDSGCDEVQGFLLSRPLPAEQFTQWCRQSAH